MSPVVYATVPKWSDLLKNANGVPREQGQDGCYVVWETSDLSGLTVIASADT